MSRSRKKNLRGGVSLAASDVDGKQKAARKYRAAVRNVLKSFDLNEDLNESLFPDQKAHTSNFGFVKDGKRNFYFLDEEERKEYLRK